jgi:cytochrome d ubiquinol oxidase subunit I
MLIILFVAGTVSGTIISIQFSVVWPQFTQIADQVVGAAFSLEGIGFFVEAAFLTIYSLTWKRLSPWKHWAVSIPIVLASTASAFFITSVNAFMNAPQGFIYKNGIVSNVQPWKAIFNPATFTETTHSIIAYWIMTAGLVATWYGIRVLRGKGSEHQKSILVAMAMALLVTAGLLGLTGDASAKYLAHYEPIKLAAAEGLFDTQSHAPLVIGGITTNGHVVGGIKIPGLLSWLAYGSSSAVVQGLRSVAPDMWPPLIVHVFFDSMVGIGTLLGLIPLIFLLLWWKRRPLSFSKPSLWLLVLTGPLAVIAVEVGWLLTEIGRQPYVIKGILTTKQALTTSSSVVHAAAIFPTLYLVLLFATGIVIKRLHFPRKAKSK